MTCRGRVWGLSLTNPTVIDFIGRFLPMAFVDIGACRLTLNANISQLNATLAKSLLEISLRNYLDLYLALKFAQFYGYSGVYK